MIGVLQTERDGSDVHKVVSPKAQIAPYVTAPGGCSSATTPKWPFPAASMSGVWLLLFGLLGLTSSRPSRILTTPSHPHSGSGKWCSTVISRLIRIDLSPPE